MSNSKNKILNGKVIKGVGGMFTVFSGERTYRVVARKKLKDYAIMVGDYCTFSLDGRVGCIETILTRKNSLVRPPIANIDRVFIVTAPEPSPDLSLIDKIIVNCIYQNIDYVIVVNKSELASCEFIQKINQNYKEIASIIYASCYNNQIDELFKSAQGGVSCFAGQSGVGKTSLINALVGHSVGLTGELSARIMRGKNTTRYASIINFEQIQLVDTSGFSLLDIDESTVKSSELMTYYPDFSEHARQCKFSTCTHTAEPDCMVKQAVSQNIICQGRYERYVELYKQLCQKEKDKY
ncbi:MAG: ribosome small subunit-dependent GTPase A [Clostridia bacterium]